MNATRGFKRLFASVLACIAMLLVLGVAAESAAQRVKEQGGTTKKKDSKDSKDSKDEPAAKPPAKKETKSGEEKLKPQAVDFVTEDGVLVAGVYFPSGAGEESPVVILLHALGRNQKDFGDFAFTLQDNGYAVLTLDFRGHGFSINLDPQAVGSQAAAKGAAQKLNFKNFRTRDDLMRLTEDIEAAKRFLVRKNNNRELNVSKLAVVGAELGASLGVLWALHDWSYPDVGFSKQGRDVRSVVMLSPQINLKGVQIDKAVASLPIPVMVIAGELESGAKREADRLYQLAHHRPTGGDSDLKLINTKLQATRLLDPDLEFHVDRTIVQFLNKTAKKGNRWEARGADDSTSK
jgi:alpha-beta hydrolase superfamily lysophospholipase